MGKYVKAFLIAIVIMCAIFEETEARRKILRGRKTLNRRYMRPTGLPAWAIVTLVGIGQLVIGALFFLLLKVLILDKPLNPRYAPAPMTPPEESPTA